MFLPALSCLHYHHTKSFFQVSAAPELHCNNQAGVCIPASKLWKPPPMVWKPMVTAGVSGDTKESILRWD